MLEHLIQGLQPFSSHGRAQVSGVPAAMTVNVCASQLLQPFRGRARARRVLAAVSGWQKLVARPATVFLTAVASWADAPPVHSEDVSARPAAFTAPRRALHMPA